METTYGPDTEVIHDDVIDADVLYATSVKLADRNQKPFSFTENPDDILVSYFDEGDLEEIFSKVKFHNQDGKIIESKDRESIVKFLLRKGGERVRDIFGYRPVARNGRGLYDPHDESNYSSGEFVFGRIYSPDVSGFEVSVSVNQSVQDKAHFKIKVPFFNSSLAGEFLTAIGQQLHIGHAPVDLVIPATYKVVRWEGKTGNHFYITELHNHGELITKREANNIYDNEAGFDQLLRSKGKVNRIGPDDYKEGDGPSFILSKEDQFAIGFEFPQLEEFYTPGTDAKAEATVKENIAIKYTVVGTYEYVMLNALSQENKRFEHYWSHMPA